MKVVITHDVDHLSTWEHWRDFVIPKFIAVSLVEWKKGLMDLNELGRRLRDIVKNGWNNVESLAKYDREHGVQSAFYFAMANGLGISYGKRKAGEVIKRLVRRGFEVGVHGIEYKDFELMKREYESFRKISGLEEFGIRVHYLRHSPETFENIERLGYAYDSTVYDENLRQPYRIGNLIEIPFHIMDTYLFSPFYGAMGLEDAIEYTESMIKKVPKDGILVVLFHQRHFSKSFLRWMEWYKWLVETCEGRGCEFVSPLEVTKWKSKK